MSGETTDVVRTARLIGGPYDGVRVGAVLPDVILVGIKRERYEVITDPNTRQRLGGYAYSPSDPSNMPTQPGGDHDA